MQNPINLGRKIGDLGRFAQIVQIFAKYGFWTVAERIGAKEFLSPEQIKASEQLQYLEQDDSPDIPTAAGGVNPRDLTGPQRLRHALEELGPAFVKLGQLLACRQDLIPDAYSMELRKLLSHVQPVPFKDLEIVLQQELDLAARAMIQSIEPMPLAAGSIAQVHRATLNDGSQVVLKIQRPGVEGRIKSDLSLMRTIGDLLDTYVPELRPFRLKSLIDEFANALTLELDFIREAGNTIRVRGHFQAESQVSIPDIHWPLTRRRVLCQSFLDGVNFGHSRALNIKGFDTHALFAAALDAFLKMVFRDGLFHGDLHQGNLLALPGNCVGMLDFGVTVPLPRPMRENLAGLLLALVQADLEELCLRYVDMVRTPEEFDFQHFEHEVMTAISPFIGLSTLRDIHMGQVLWSFARIAAKHKIPLPREFALFLKTLVSFEGVGQQLVPDFDLARALQDASAGLVKEIQGQDAFKRQLTQLGRDGLRLLQASPMQIRHLLRNLSEGRFSLKVGSPDIARLARALDRASARLAVSLIVASLIIGSSILAFGKLGGEFLNISIIGLIGYCLAALLAVYIIFSIIRDKSSS